MAGVIALAGGCKSGGDSTYSSETRSPGSTSLGATADTKAAARTTEEGFVIGPAMARELNYLLDWQYAEAGNGLRHLSVQGDSVFTLDNRNMLTRIRLEDGTRLWRVAVADPIDRVFGVNFIDGRVYVATGGSMFVLDGANGSQIGKSQLEKIANTAQVEFGQFLIYGSQNGQVIWHARSIGQHWRGYEIAPSIQIAPVVCDGKLAVVGTGGHFSVLSASSATRVWSERLLSEVVAAPAAGDGAVFIAGQDQYLRAFDLNSGHRLWWVLMETPLSDSPVLIGERVYQQIPGHGLRCYAAQPIDLPGGKEIWRSAEVKGNVISQKRDTLFVWDAPSRTLSFVDAARGLLVKSFNLPKVTRLVTAGKNNNDLYASSEDGRVVRLVPRN